jgi:hypothetical protein
MDWPVKERNRLQNEEWPVDWRKEMRSPEIRKETQKKQEKTINER